MMNKVVYIYSLVLFLKPGECGTALSILAIKSATKVTTHVVRDTHDVMRDVTSSADAHSPLDVWRTEWLDKCAEIPVSMTTRSRIDDWSEAGGNLSCPIAINLTGRTSTYGKQFDPARYDRRVTPAYAKPSTRSAVRVLLIGFSYRTVAVILSYLLRIFHTYNQNQQCTA